MKIHPRYWIVQKAKHEVTETWLNVLEKYELTSGESVKVLAELLQDQAKYAIRFERHPDDPDKKGDEE